MARSWGFLRTASFSPGRPGGTHLVQLNSTKSIRLTRLSTFDRVLPSRRDRNLIDKSPGTRPGSQVVKTPVGSTKLNWRDERSIVHERPTRTRMNSRTASNKFVRGTKARRTSLLVACRQAASGVRGNRKRSILGSFPSSLEIITALE